MRLLLLYTITTAAAFLSLPEREVARSNRRLDSNVLGSFRKIEQSSLRGWNQGGVFDDTLTECAHRCVLQPKCQSFDYDTSTLQCFISFSTRYQHPDDFQYYPTSSYYEWQGLIQSPSIYPNGGSFHAHVSVTFLTTARNATIHYRILDQQSNESTPLYTIQSGGTIVLHEKSCRVLFYATKEGMSDSIMMESNLYEIKEAKYGFLVPFYNGQMHGNAVRVTLDVRGKKRPRPAQYHEFSNFNSPRGVGPYEDQIQTIDLTQYDPSLKGFRNGFAAINTIEYIHLQLPTLYQSTDGIESTTYTLGATVVRESRMELRRRSRFDATDPVLIGAVTSKRTEEFAYYIPYHNGQEYFGKFVRIRTASFDETILPDIEVLDLTEIDPSLRGFSSGFNHGNFGYLISSKHDTGFSGKLVRVDLTTFSASSVEILNLEPQLIGFSHAFTYEDFAYFVPLQSNHDRRTDIKRHDPIDYFSGLIARVNLKDFNSIETLDLQEINSQYVGFSAGFTVGHYGYFVPYRNKISQPSVDEYSPLGNSFSGLLVRINLIDFTFDTALDLSKVDDRLRGFVGGFSSGKYGVLVPYRHGIPDESARSHSGMIVRFDTTDFTLQSVKFMDVSQSSRSQIPNRPDNDLRGFSGGFASGKYGYFVPNFNGADFSGKFCRVDIEGFVEMQFLDISQSDLNNRGFFGGFSSVAHDPIDVPLFGPYIALPGTDTIYKFTY